MFDCHVHSNFSTDSNMSMDAACISAINKGLKGIAFTDHLDFDFPGFEEDFNIDFPKYFQCTEHMKIKYKDQLKIITGLEAGIQKHVADKTDQLIKNYKFDYVIGSVHIIDNLDPYDGEYYKDKTKYTAYKRYLEEILLMIKNFDNFDILGHFDYITRYANYDDISIKYTDYPDVFDKILSELISKGKGIEINTGTYRKQAKLDYEILKRYRELGGELICLGSDSHEDKFLAHKFDYFRQMLIQTGFKYTVTFHNRKPKFNHI